MPLNQLIDGHKGFVYKHIGVLPVFDEPFVGMGISRVHERHPVPIEPVRHGPVQDVDGGEGGDRYPVLLVHHPWGGVVELLDDDLTGAGREPGDLAALDIPAVRLADMVDEVLGTQLGPVSCWAPHVEGDLAGCHPTADPQRGNVAAVVGVEVAEKHLVGPVVRHHRRGETGDRPGADIEKERVTVAELDEPCRRRLRGAEVWHPGAEGGDPHLVIAQDLGLRVVVIAVVVRTLRPCRGFDLAVGDLFVLHNCSFLQLAALYAERDWPISAHMR